jgi:hypothetical protein
MKSPRQTSFAAIISNQLLRKVSAACLLENAVILQYPGKITGMRCNEADSAGPQYGIDFSAAFPEKARCQKPKDITASKEHGSKIVPSL